MYQYLLLLLSYPMAWFLNPVKNAKSVWILIILWAWRWLLWSLWWLGIVWLVWGSILSPLWLMIIAWVLGNVFALVAGFWLYRSKKWAVYLLWAAWVLSLIVYFAWNQSDIDPLVYWVIQIALFIWFYSAMDQFWKEEVIEKRDVM